MRVTITIEDDEGKQVTQVSKDCESSLSDVAGVMSDAVTASFGYPVAAALVTEYAAWDRDGLLTE